MLRYFYELGPLHFSSYGLMLVISFWLAGFMVRSRGRSIGLQVDWLLFVSLMMMILGIVGSRLLFVFSEFGLDVLKNPKMIFQTWNGGLSFAGGYVLAVLFGLWQSRLKGVSFLSLMDVIMPSVALGLGITKVGCFLAGCCFGKASGLPWSVTYTETHTACALKNTPLHPAQLYEAAMGLTVFFLLQSMWKNRRFQGQIFLSFLILYGVGRVSLEFFRASEKINSWGLSTPQTVFLTLAIVAVLAWRPLARLKAIKD